MDSQYKLLSELLSDQAAFITSPKTSLANYWGGIAPLPPSVYGPVPKIPRGLIERLTNLTDLYLRFSSEIREAYLEPFSVRVTIKVGFKAYSQLENI